MRSASHSGMNGISTASVPALDPSIRMGTQRKLMSSSSRRASRGTARWRKPGSSVRCGTTVGVPRWATVPVMPSPTR